MANCSDCKHWELANAWKANDENVSRFSRRDSASDETILPASDLQWSRCARAEAGFEHDFDAAERKMAAWDGSRYYAELITREDFHCCEHEVRSIEAMQEKD